MVLSIFLHGKSKGQRPVPYRMAISCSSYIFTVRCKFQGLVGLSWAEYWIIGVPFYLFRVLLFLGQLLYCKKDIANY
jgi:hypothetical protein